MIEQERRGLIIDKRTVLSVLDVLAPPLWGMFLQTNLTLGA
jgi:hypothetical protein